MRFLPAVFLSVATMAPLGAATLADFQAIHAPPECDTAAISPDGKLLAAIMRLPGAATLRVIDIEAAKVALTVNLDAESSQGPVFDQIIWANPTRMIVQAGVREIFAVDVDGKNHRRLINWDDPFWYQESEVVAIRVARRNVKLVAWSADDPDYVHIEASWIGRFAVVRVHHGTGKAELTWEGSGDEPLLYDRLGVARVRTISREKPERYDLRTSAGKASPWVPLDRAIGTEKQSEYLVTAANAHGPRSLPLGFGRDPEVLFFASNVGRDTLGIYAVDLRTKRRTEFALEDPNFDLSPQFLSRFGESILVRERKSGEVVGARTSRQQAGAIWAEQELRAVQEQVEKLMPNHGVRIENWDDARERFLVRFSHRGDPGGFAIYSRADGSVRSYISRAPRVAALGPAHSTPWVVKRPDGTRITGHLTLPGGSHNTPLPVIVIIRATVWDGAPAGYSPDARSFVQMGYAVLEVAHRGVLGRGLRHWEAGRGRLDEVIAEDIFSALQTIAAQARLDGSKVALFGAYFGATAALKVAILRPERVACVVAQGPLMDIFSRVRDTHVDFASSVREREMYRAYFGPDDGKLKAWSPAVFAPQITRPVMAVTVKRNYTSSIYDPTADFIKKLKATKTPPFVLEESDVKGFPEMSARISVATEKFLAEHLPLARP